MKIKIIGVLIVILAFFFTCIYVQGLDIHILKSINLNRDKSFDFFFIWLTDSAAIVAYGTPFLLLLISLIKRNNVAQRNSLYVIISLVSAGIIVTSLKYSIDRTRPFLTYSFIQSVSDGGSPSFPSGHTSDAFVLATSLTLIYRKWYVILPFLIWALAVAYSRMDLGVHYPSDVMGGIIIGSGSALLCYGVRKRFNEQQINA